MGQYFLIVNVDKREYVDPDSSDEDPKLTPGVTLWPQSLSRLRDLLMTGSKGSWAGDRIVVLGDEGDFWQEWSGERLTWDEVVEEFREVSGRPAAIEDPRS